LFYRYVGIPPAWLNHLISWVEFLEACFDFSLGFSLPSKMPRSLLRGSLLKILLWIFKLIVGIPMVYSYQVLVIYYIFYGSWEDSYKIAGLNTVLGLFALAIRYAIKHGGR
jgi:hypothetical protein